MKYTIPESKRADIEKAVSRISKKAEKYGKEFSVKYGIPYATEVAVYEVGFDFTSGTMVPTKTLDRTMMVEAFDIEIEADIIRKDGYSVIAQIEHLDGGNIVVPFEGEVQKEWLHSECTCDHCKTSRVRKYTFIVRKDGEDLQVGKTCLKDYCGIDPQVIGCRNELTDILINNDVDSIDWGMFSGIEPAYDTIEMLALAIRAYKKQGYVKSEMPNSNKDLIREMVDSNVHPTEAEMAQATEMAKVIKGMEDSEAISFLLSDARTLICTAYCKAKHFGYIAYAPVAYEKYQAELAKRAEREADHLAQMASEYVGEIGKRQTFDISEMTLVTSWPSRYGTTVLYKFVTTGGDVLVWFASELFGKWVARGGKQDFVDARDLDIKRIKATVKDHRERDGVRQTIINRVKVA